jgi:hypothetical protein
VLKVIVGVALLLIVALIGQRRTFTRLRLPTGARLIYRTGTEFILVGVALGDTLIGLLDEQTVRSLTPLFTLGLGAIGLLFGIQLEVRKILRFPGRYLPMAASQALFTMLAVAWPAYLILDELFADDSQAIMLASLVLGATAACTAQTALALIGREYGLRGAPLMDLLRYISSTDAVVGLVALGLAFCLMHGEPVIGFETGISLQWFALSLGIGVAMGFLLHLLTRIRCREEELLIFVIGMVTFSSGIALYLHLSALFVNATMGITLANLPGSKDRIFNVLAGLERPFYIVFLVMAGAIWSLGSPWALPLAAIYLGLRLAGKLGGGYLAARLAPEDSAPPRLLGMGLVSQGGIALAMVMDYYQLGSGQLTGVVVSIVLIAVISNELVSPSLTRHVLRTAGEITS